MPTITTGNHPAALWPGVQAWYGNTYNDWNEEYSQLFELVDSSKNYEEDIVTRPFGLAPAKPEGEALSYDQHTQGPTKRYTNITYAIGYIVTWEELQDNMYEQVSAKRAPMIARSMRQTIETVGANVYNRATDTNYTGADAKELLATDHPTLAGNQSNELATAADLSEASLEDIVIQIMQAQDERGLKIQLMPRKLLVHPNEAFNAERILKSTLQNDTANNAINALRSMSILPDGSAVNHYFNDADQWFVRTDCPESMKFIWRYRPSEPEQDNDFDTKNAKVACIARFVAGWSDWRGVFGSPGA